MLASEKTPTSLHTPFPPRSPVGQAAGGAARIEAWAPGAGRTGWTAGCRLRPGWPLLQACYALMDKIPTQLRYDSSSTEVNTPALQALQQR